MSVGRASVTSLDILIDTFLGILKVLVLVLGGWIRLITWVDDLLEGT